MVKVLNEIAEQKKIIDKLLDAAAVVIITYELIKFLNEAKWK